MDLLLETAAFRLGRAAGLDRGVGEHRAATRLGLFDHHARLLLRFRDRLVGRALREKERAVQHVFRLAAATRIGRPARQAFLQHSRLLVQRFDRSGSPLEEVIDLVAVVAAERFANLDVSELSRCHVHPSTVTIETREVVVSPRAGRYRA